MYLKITSEVMLSGGETVTDAILKKSGMSGTWSPDNNGYISFELYRSLADMQAGRDATKFDSSFKSGRDLLNVQVYVPSWDAVNTAGGTDAFAIAGAKARFTQYGLTVEDLEL